MRSCMRFVKKSLQGKLVGAEVGVHRGEHAFAILKEMPNVELLVLIDPYCAYEGWCSPYAGTIEKAKEIAKEKLFPYKNRIRWIYKKFGECNLAEIPTLDFVYIDGNHEYEYVKNDIILSRKLVKNNGVVGGHDYIYYDGVRNAVDDYCRDNHLKLHCRGEDWWFLNKR